jgi:hypothetical protein
MKSFTKREGNNGVLSYGLYQMYKQIFKGSMRASECNVSYVQWLRICKKFNQRVMAGILQGYVFKMPYRLGSIGVVQTKKKIRFKEDGTLDPRNLVINWEKTYILWKQLYPDCVKKSDYKKYKDKPLLYYTNEHTDGRVMKFHWKKKGSSMKNKSVYSFTPSFNITQELGKLIFNNPNIQYCTKF